MSSTGHGEIADALINAGADIEAAAKGRSRAIHFASMAFDVDGARCVKLLVDAGADVNVRDAFGEGQTPLWYAAYNSSFAIVCTLVEANAEIDNPKYNTPMYVAAEFGFVENVEYLLAHGARIDTTKEKRILRQPIHAAATNGHIEVCARLLHWKADVNVKDDEGMSPLMLAAGSGPEMVRWCLNHGALVHDVNKDGESALHFAAETGANGASS